MRSSDPKRGSERPNDIRFDKHRQARIEHHSAKGEVVRNVGSFTRGTQLVRLEYMMVWQGVKLPLMVGAGCFFLLLCLLMLFRMHEHETQLVLMRMLSSFWSWCDLSPSKEVNLTLPGGSAITTTMSAIPDNPAVESAWDIFTRCFLASGIGAGFLTVPITIWFTNLAHHRGTDILKERHERGAMLVEPEILVDEIEAYNFSKLAEAAAKKDPPYDPYKVARAPLAKQLEHGFHVPYKVAEISYPYDLERTHGMLIGTTGTGKTTILLRIIEQARARNHRCVIFDLTGVFVQHFYNPKTDFILNPIDNRCPPWSVFSDCHNILEFSSAAAALFPSPNEGGDPFWTMSARTLFVEMCVKLYERKERSNAALTHHLMYAKLKDLNRAMKGTIADPLTSMDSARMAESIRAVVNTQAQILRYLPDVNETHPTEFSIRNWVQDDKQDGSILFITSNHTHLNVTKPLLSLWMDMAVNAVLETERNAGLKIWFLFDEVHALQRLPALENGLQTARAYGGAFLLGIHSFERLCETYGKEGGTNLAALARTKVILTAADRTTAEFCASQIGNREVREVDEAYSIGAAMSRDAATITPRTEVKPLVLPDDIMNFPSMYGVIKFPEGFPAARIKLVYKPFDVIALPFDEKKTLTQTVYRAPANDTDDEADGESGREPSGAKTTDLGLTLDPENDTLAQAAKQDALRLDPREITTADIDANGRPTNTEDQSTPVNPILADLIGTHQMTFSAGPQKGDSSKDGNEQTPDSPKASNKENVAVQEQRTGVSAVDTTTAHHKHNHPHEPAQQPARDRGDDFQYGD